MSKILSNPVIFVSFGLALWGLAVFTGNAYRGSLVDVPTVLSSSTSNPTPFRVLTYPPLTTQKDVTITGDKRSDVSLTANGLLFSPAQQTATSGQNVVIVPWQLPYRLQEGMNEVRFVGTNESGSFLVEKKVNIVLDTISPSCALSYSKPIADVGVLKIKLTCTETISPAPYISIDQPGSVDIIGALMQGSGAVWSYDYTVNASDGFRYKDGVARINITTNGDLAGNPISSVQNREFMINTTLSTTTGPITDNTSATSVTSSSKSTTSTTSSTTAVTSNQQSTTVDTAVQPAIELLALGKKNREASLQKGGILSVIVRYRVDSSSNFDSSIGQYTYLAGSRGENFTGFAFGLSNLDPQFASRPVKVSAPVRVSEGVFERELLYRLSDVVEAGLRPNREVTLEYYVAGKPASNKLSLMLRLASQELSQLRVNKVNDIEVDMQITPSAGRPEESHFQPKVILAPQILLDTGYTIRGKGPANSKIVIQIYSQPITVEVVTDENGDWEYTLQQELTPGTHTVYAALATDDALPTDFVQIFNFEVAAVEAAGVAETEEIVTGDVTFTSDISQVAAQVQDNTIMKVLFIVAVVATLIAASMLGVIYFRGRSVGDNLF